MAISIGDALLKLGIDTKDLDKGMKGLSGRIQKHNKAIGLAMTAAGGAIIAMGVSSVRTFAQMGDEVQKMALRTGFSTEALSELRHAAEISGASLTTLEKGVKRMSGTILDAQDGLETYIRAFQHIGIEVEALDGLNPEQQFLMIAEAIAEVEDPTKRAAIAQDIFGRAGTELLPLFAAGKEGLKDLREEAHKLGIVFDQEAANQAANLTDAMHRTEEAVSGLKMKIATALIPIIIPLVEKITNLITQMGAWMKAHPGLSKVITIVGMGLGALLLVLGPLLIILPSLTAALPLLGAAFTFALGPIGLIIAGIAALIAIGVLVWKNWDTIKEKSIAIWGAIKKFFIGIWEKITKIFSEHWDKILAILFPAIGIPILIAREWDNIKKFLQKLNPWEWIKEGWNKLREGIKGVLKKIFGGSDIEHWVSQLDGFLSGYDLAPAGRKMFETYRAGVKAQLDGALDDMSRFVQKTDDILTEARRTIAGAGWPEFRSPAEEEAFIKAEMARRGIVRYEKGVPVFTPEAAERYATIEQAVADIYQEYYGKPYPGKVGGRLFEGVTEAPSYAPTPVPAPIAGFPGFTYVPGFQRGGIAMRPMLAAIAERKPEAVIPLDKLEGMIGGREVNIYVELDGRVLMKAIGQPLVDEIRLRTGVRI